MEMKKILDYEINLLKFFFEKLLMDLYLWFGRRWIMMMGFSDVIGLVEMRFLVFINVIDRYGFLWNKVMCMYLLMFLFFFLILILKNM